VSLPGGGEYRCPPIGDPLTLSAGTCMVAFMNRNPLPTKKLNWELLLADLLRG
jgi:hypothetical protein